MAEDRANAGSTHFRSAGPLVIVLGAVLPLLALALTLNRFEITAILIWVPGLVCLVLAMTARPGRLIAIAYALAAPILALVLADRFFADTHSGPYASWMWDVFVNMLQVWKHGTRVVWAILLTAIVAALGWPLAAVARRRADAAEGKVAVKGEDGLGTALAVTPLVLLTPFMLAAASGLVGVAFLAFLWFVFTSS